MHFPICALADEDRLASPTFVHTKHILPTPWRSGEILARADYRGKQGTTRFRQLTIKIGKNTIEVPQRILAIFSSVKLGSFELYSGPPPDPGYRRYFNVTFRFGSWANEGTYSDPGPVRLIAWIVIENGRITQVKRIEEWNDGITKHTNIDPKSLKETGGHWNTGDFFSR